MKNVIGYVLSVFLSVLSMNVLAITHQQDIKPPLEPIQAINSEDEYETFNRSIYRFNMGFHELIGSPVTQAYTKITPKPVRTGLNNFFSNLTVPIDALNSLMQGKVEESLSSFMRFTLNSTFGLAGLLDIATPAGLPKHNEDLGQTLFAWGVWNEANFIVVPFLGPNTTRSLVGQVVENSADPINLNPEIDQNHTQIMVGNAFVNYVKAAPVIDTLSTQPDAYLFMRESYLQYRTNLLFDGQPPQANLDDFNFD